VFFVRAEGYGLRRLRSGRERFRIGSPGQRRLQFRDDRPDVGDHKRQVPGASAQDAREGSYIRQNDVRTKTTADTRTAAHWLSRR